MTNNLDLAAQHALALALAGDDFRWQHPDAPKTIDTAHRRGLTLWLMGQQNGLCAACGETFEGAVELAHIVASRVAARGIMAGNVYAGHKGCNDDDSKVYGDVVPLDSLIRADLIPADGLPTRAECHRLAREADRVREARRAARDAALAAAGQ